LYNYPNSTIIGAVSKPLNISFLTNPLGGGDQESITLSLLSKYGFLLSQE